MNVLDLEPGTEALQELEYALVLPTYNEASRREDVFRNTIESLQAGLGDHFGNATDWTLAIGDDGSKDHTVNVANEYGLPIVEHPDKQNHGRGAILKLALPLLASRAKIVAYTDADGSYSLDSILSQLQSVKEGADIAVAKRPESRGQHTDLLRLFGHTAISRLCEFIAPTGVSDPQAGLQTFSQDSAIALWPHVQSERWAANREVLFLAHLISSRSDIGFKISEQEAAIRPCGESSVHIVKDTIRMVRDSITMRRQEANAATLAATTGLGIITNNGSNKSYATRHTA